MTTTKNLTKLITNLKYYILNYTTPSSSFVFFFFSSRRRHTRSKRDWSSDVCSSDLERWRSSASWWGWSENTIDQRRDAACSACSDVDARDFDQHVVEGGCASHVGQCRSEERRVGKECRAMRGAQYEKKNTDKDVDIR